MTHQLTREELVEHLSALERRVIERLDLLERLIALGFDDASDQLRMRLGSHPDRPDLGDLSRDN
jgi:hypothetical protein